jgi:hypothetical protein
VIKVRVKSLEASLILVAYQDGRQSGRPDEFEKNCPKCSQTLFFVKTMKRLAFTVEKKFKQTFGFLCNFQKPARSKHFPMGGKSPRRQSRSKLYQVTVIYHIFHSKGFQNIPKVGIFGMKKYYLATLDDDRIFFLISGIRRKLPDPARRQSSQNAEAGQASQSREAAEAVKIGQIRQSVGRSLRKFCSSVCLLFHFFYMKPRVARFFGPNIPKQEKNTI